MGWTVAPSVIATGSRGDPAWRACVFPRFAVLREPTSHPELLRGSAERSALHCARSPGRRRILVQPFPVVTTHGLPSRSRGRRAFVLVRLSGGSSHKKRVGLRQTAARGHLQWGGIGSVGTSRPVVVRLNQSSRSARPGIVVCLTSGKPGTILDQDPKNRFGTGIARFACLDGKGARRTSKRLTARFRARRRRRTQWRPCQRIRARVGLSIDAAQHIGCGAWTAICDE